MYHRQQQKEEEEKNYQNKISINKKTTLKVLLHSLTTHTTTNTHKKNLNEKKMLNTIQLKKNCCRGFFEI